MQHIRARCCRCDAPYPICARDAHLCVPQGCPFVTQSPFVPHLILTTPHMETLTTSYTDCLDGGVASPRARGRLQRRGSSGRGHHHAKAVAAALKLAKLFEGDAGGDASWSWLPLSWCRTLSEANDALAEWDKLREGSQYGDDDGSFVASSGGVGFAAQVAQIQRVEEFRLKCKQNNSLGWSSPASSRALSRSSSLLRLPFRPSPPAPPPRRLPSSPPAPPPRRLVRFTSSS